MTDPDADHLDSSGGPQSPGQSPFAPGSPFAEYYRPPRLGIIHLLAWTAATAVLLKFSMGMQMIGARGVASTSPELDIAFQAFRFLYSAAHAAGIVGSGVLLLAMIRRLPGRFQPGHWLVLIETLTALLWLLSWGLCVVLPETTGVTRGALFPWILVVDGLVAILCSGGYFYAAVAFRGDKRWKICLGVLAGVGLVGGLWYVGINVLGSPRWSFDFPLGSLIVGLSLLVAVVVDLCRGPRRDWLHWLGVAIVATEVVLAAGWWAWWVYAGRMLVF